MAREGEVIFALNGELGVRLERSTLNNKYSGNLLSLSDVTNVNILGTQITASYNQTLEKNTMSGVTL
jgi:hypothetical protein